MRRELDGAELDLMRHPDFVMCMTPLLHSMKEREKALHAAGIDAIDRKYTPGRKPRRLLDAPSSCQLKPPSWAAFLLAD
jgi:hypothetical protein